jgi:hypothetical protein
MGLRSRSSSLEATPSTWLALPIYASTTVFPIGVPELLHYQQAGKRVSVPVLWRKHGNQSDESFTQADRSSAMIASSTKHRIYKLGFTAVSLGSPQRKTEQA